MGMSSLTVMANSLLLQLQKFPTSKVEASPGLNPRLPSAAREPSTAAARSDPSLVEA